MTRLTIHGSVFAVCCPASFGGEPDFRSCRCSKNQGSRARRDQSWRAGSPTGSGTMGGDPKDRAQLVTGHEQFHITPIARSLLFDGTCCLVISSHLFCVDTP